MIYSSDSLEKTKIIAGNFAKALSGGQKVALIGDLGAGKTAFTQGLVAALGSIARVKSPTYTIINEYAITGHPTIKKVIHLDFYRFTNASEVHVLELESYSTPQTLIVAEWPNAISLSDFPFDFTITIEHTEDGRSINIEP